VALAQTKQADIIKKAKEIEQLLVDSYKKMDKTITFGGKVKFAQEKIKNPFLIDSLWNLVKTRNFIAHDNDFSISLKEYELFLANYSYVKEKI
jgi:hypothetical protein